MKLCEGTVKSQRGDHAAFGPIVQIDIAVMQAPGTLIGASRDEDDLPGVSHLYP